MTRRLRIGDVADRQKHAAASRVCYRTIFGRFTTTTTTTTKVLVIVTLHKVTGALYISD